MQPSKTGTKVRLRHRDGNTMTGQLEQLGNPAKWVQNGWDATELQLALDKMRDLHSKNYGYPTLSGERTGSPAVLYCEHCLLDWPCATMAVFEEG